jgi:hypothetical protein
MIIDFKHGRLDPAQIRKDKKVPLPTIYVKPKDILPRAKQLFRKNRRIDPLIAPSGDRWGQEADDARNARGPSPDEVAQTGR